MKIFQDFNQEVQENSQSRFKRRNGKTDSKYHWPNATIPFQIDSTVISKVFKISVKFLKFVHIFLSSRTCQDYSGSD